MNLLENNELELNLFDEIDNEFKKQEENEQNIFEQYINDVGYVKPFLNDKNEEIGLSVEEQEEVLEYIYKNCSWVISTSLREKFLLLDNNFEEIYLKESELLNHLSMSLFKHIKTNQKILNEKTQKYEQKDIFLVNINNALAYLKVNKQISSINYELDLFAKESHTYIKDKILYIVKNKTQLNISEKQYIEPKMRKEAMECINDYKEYFPEFEEILKLGAASLFTDKRKPCFNNIKAFSNFGKDFLSNALENIGAGYQLKFGEIEKSAGGYSVRDVFGRIFLIETEFKTFGSRMKEFELNINLEPKFALKSKVDVFSKMLINHEDSTLDYDVETQIINRITQYILKQQKQLAHREIVKKYGTDFCRIAVENFAYITLKKEIEKYVEMGKFKAAKEAADAIEKQWETHKISESKNLNTSLKSYIIEKIQYIYAKRNTSYFYNRYSDCVYFKEEENDNLGHLENVLDTEIYITNLKEFMSKIIDESADKNFKKTSSYKTNNFLDIFGLEGTKTFFHPLYRTTKRGVVLTLEDIGISLDVE